MPPHYHSGVPIQAGDRVLWHGDPGVIEFIADPECQPESWWVTEYGGGVMVTPPTAFISNASLPDYNDLVFVSRKGSPDALDL